MTKISKPNLDRAKRLVEEEWTDPAVVEAWRKWHEPWTEFFNPYTELMRQAGEIHAGQTILDVASGSGEPAITFARLVGSLGAITCTDMSVDMLKVAEANVKEAGLDNVSFKIADAHDLPFADNSFDRVVCRHGVMYFADDDKALREFYRVLKPDGRAVMTSAGPFEQPLYTNTFGILLKYAELPTFATEGLDPLRFATEGSLTKALQEAGFRHSQDKLVSPSLTWPGSAENLWQWSAEWPVCSAMIKNLPEERREEIFKEIQGAIKQHEKNERVTMPVVSTLAVGIK